ncbi:glycosyl transferase [Dactylosporangium salmoneum]|uniref:Glycosyl transferase n=2 Tax=Dactylosporangium salmoneum TaxID=53361 RepID=A0ABP5TTQ5_9ACTN
MVLRPAEEAAQRREDTQSNADITDSAWRRWVRRADLLPVASYLLLMLFIVAPLLIGRGGTIPIQAGDRAQAELFLAHAAHFVTHGGNPLFIANLNAPFGVNAMANTSALGLGIPMAPVTLMFGAQASFDVLMVLAVVATATSWYWLFSRHLATNRAAAWVGGLVGGFAPAVASHISYHPNLAAQFAVPLLIWRSCKLLEGRPVRNGLLLAAVVVYQAFVNEETLLLAALGMASFMTLYALQRREVVRTLVRPLAAGLAVTAGAAGAVLAYPLYFQFYGPGSYHGGEPAMTKFRLDVLGLTTYGSNSIAERLRRFNTPSPFGLGAEEHGYFGWSLVVLLVVLVWWQWRDVRVRCLAVTGLGFAVLAMGSPLQYEGVDTGIKGPFGLLNDLPLFDTALPTRFGQVTQWAVVLLVAIGIQRLSEIPGLTGRNRQALICGLVAVALVPAAPWTLKVVDRPPTPTFITAGTWRQYVGRGQTVLVVPLPQWDWYDGMAWAAATNEQMPLSHGYFLGPKDGIEGHHATVGPVTRPTDDLFAYAAYQYKVPPIGDEERAQARADLRYWHASLVIVPASAEWVPARDTVTALFGPAKGVGGVWMWDVRNELR